MNREEGIKGVVLSIKNFVLDILFPVECLGCGKEGEWLCGECQNKIRPDSHSLRGEFLDRIFTFYSYDNELFKKAIHGLKYKFVEEISSPLGKILVKEIEKIEGQIGRPDFIAPVPLHRKRLLERGYNQSELLSLKISEYFGWPMENKVLARSRRTASQVSLSGGARKENVCGAFTVIDSSKVLNRKIVLVDDVTTTGATMEECAKALKLAGAKEVLGVALAKG
ncbi:MAG: ComF family protein [Gemmatimonadaceae bacterium]|nr:ComF family protein [Gemmatimonadaceae bacterium]